jgi:hypothetical protein
VGGTFGACEIGVLILPIGGIIEVESGLTVSTTDRRRERKRGKVSSANTPTQNMKMRIDEGGAATHLQLIHISRLLPQLVEFTAQLVGSRDVNELIKGMRP